MIKDKEQNYFKAGELATLFGISKQTLLYYDKVQLLAPDFISDNGYRHYSIQQFLDLEIIVNMRALNIAIADIKNYLQNRSKENFISIIRKKDIECENIIKENERIRISLQMLDINLNTHHSFILDQLTLGWHDEKLLRLTELSTLDSGKNRIMQFAKHSQKTFHNKGTLEKRVGWVVEQEHFFSGEYPSQSKAFFSYAPNVPHHKQVEKYSLPAGLYIEVYFEGTFYEKSVQLTQKISRFLDINCLNANGDIFVLPIENHWFYHNTDKYINKLFLNVTSIK